MKSVREKLSKIKNSEIADASQIIATELLTDFDNHQYLSQKTLAKRCNISESTITWFAKKMGFSGYRELLSVMKVENDIYSVSNEQSKEFPSKMRDFQSKVFNNLDNLNSQAEKLNEIISYLNNAKNVFIFASYDQENNAASLFNIFLIKNKSVFYSNQRKINNYFINKIKQGDLVLFLISGLDNSFLVDQYNRIHSEIIKITIGTPSQIDKLINPKVSIIIRKTEGLENYDLSKNIAFCYALLYLGTGIS